MKHELSLIVTSINLSDEQKIFCFLADQLHLWCVLDTRLPGYHVPGMDFLGGRSSSVADLSHWTGSLGPDERRPKKVSVMHLYNNDDVFVWNFSYMLHSDI